MSRTKFRQDQANRSLVSFEDLKAGYKEYQVGSGVSVVSTSALNPTTGIINLSGSDLFALELEVGDVITLSGTGGADGDYRISSVVSSSQLYVVASSMVTSTGGTANLYYQEGSRYLGVNQAALTTLTGSNVQDVLQSTDTNIQTLFDAQPQATYDFPIGGGSILPFTLYGGLVQAALTGGRYRAWLPAGNATTITAIGSAAPTATGTATTRTVATTNTFTMRKRVAYVSAATAGSSSGIRLNALQYGRGSINGGGFLLSARFGCSDAATVAQARSFVGMIGATAVIGNVNPSTLLNCIGIGHDSGDTNLSIIHNDAAGGATKIPLGADFPANALSQDIYHLILYAPPNQSYVEYYVEREYTSFVATGRLTTDLPAALLSIQLWRNNGSTALAVGLDVMGVQIQ